MKNLLLLCALALPLAACDPNVEIAKVQTQTVAACKFLPTAQTVAGIAAALYAPATFYLDAAGTIADKICQAVTVNPLADGPGPKNYKPQVAGVLVKGSFVK